MVDPDWYKVDTGDTIFTSKFSGHVDAEKEEPLFSAETVRQEIKKTVQEEMDDKDSSSELIGRLMEKFADLDDKNGDTE